MHRIGMCHVRIGPIINSAWLASYGCWRLSTSEEQIMSSNRRDKTDTGRKRQAEWTLMRYTMSWWRAHKMPKIHNIPRNCWCHRAPGCCCAATVEELVQPDGNVPRRDVLRLLRQPTNELTDQIKTRRQQMGHEDVSSEREMNQTQTLNEIRKGGR